MTEKQLLPDSLLKKLPPFYSNENLKASDQMCLAKFFYPDSNWTWYPIEYDPEKRIFFGLVDGFEMELGYFSLDELLENRGKMGLEIERDLYWKPKSVSEIKKARAER